MGAIFRLAEPNQARAGWETDRTSHRTGPSGLIFFPGSATKPTPCPGWGEGCNGHRAGGAGCSPTGASAPQSALHARCTLAARLPAPTIAQQRVAAPAVPSVGTHLCLPSLAPAQGKGENRRCSVSAGEHWDQGSSIVYYQYLSWPGSTACWRKQGRGRAPNILCIPYNESKARAVAPVLGVNQM